MQQAAASIVSPKCGAFLNKCSGCHLGERLFGSVCVAGGRLLEHVVSCARQAGIGGLSLYDCLWEHLLALSLEDLGRVRRFVLEHWAVRAPPLHTWAVLLYEVVQVRPLLSPNCLPLPSTPCIGTPTAVLIGGGATLLSQAACRYPPCRACLPMPPRYCCLW